MSSLLCFLKTYKKSNPSIIIVNNSNNKLFLLALTLLVNSLSFYLTLDNIKGKKDEEVKKVLQNMLPKISEATKFLKKLVNIHVKIKA